MNNLSERIAERLRDRAYSSKFPDPLLEAAANEIDRLRNGAVRGCETVQPATNHDAAPAAKAVSDEDRTDKAATSHRDDGTGDTPVTEPMLKEKRDEVSYALTDAEREALTFFVVLSHSKDGRIARHANTLGAMLERLA